MSFRRAVRKNRGFSLIEITGALLLITILVTALAVSLRGSIEQEGPRALAYAVASDLRAARAEAQRSGKMVAFCFPSDNKTNSIAKSALLRKGNQRGQISRILSYGEEYDAYFFLGTWPGSAAMGDTSIPVSWDASTSDEVAIIFRSDGSAFSNDLPAIDGNFPIVIGSGFSGTFNGPTGTLTHATQPNTVWVSSAGSIDVDEKKLPVGTLPIGESPLTVATLDLSSEPPPGTPVMLSAEFFPQLVPGNSTAYIGQNYVDVHPDQKDTSRLEYGVASIEIMVEDSDGGPLEYELTATTTGSEGPGNYTVPVEGSSSKGLLRYKLVENHDFNGDGMINSADHRHVWHASISWRPPPNEVADVVYELSVDVTDPEGNVLNISTGAGQLPSVTSLPPARLVVCTDNGDKDLYITNLDGSNEVHITKNGDEERPFFSNDGSRIFSFHPLSGTQDELRSRPADGSTGYIPLTTINSPTGSSVINDPEGRFAAILSNPYSAPYDYGVVHAETDTDPNTGATSVTYSLRVVSQDRTVRNLQIISLSDGTTVANASHIKPSTFEWGSSPRYSFRYTAVERTPWGPIETPRVGDHHLSPGLVEPQNTFQITGYPPTAIPLTSGFLSNGNVVRNAADPGWYLSVSDADPNDGVAEGLTAVSPAGVNNPIPFSGVVQYNPNTGVGPRWSADGTHISYVRNPGVNSEINAVRILRESSPTTLDWDGVNTTFQRTAPNQTSPTVSPTTDYVYFVDNNRLYRNENSTGSADVEISGHLGGTVIGYAVSP